MNKRMVMAVLLNHRQGNRHAENHGMVSVIDSIIRDMVDTIGFKNSLITAHPEGIYLDIEFAKEDIERQLQRLLKEDRRIE